MKCIYIANVRSYVPGFGTAICREIVRDSLKQTKGIVKLQAAWSSHLFWLFMGMIPEDRNISYLKHYYGFSSCSIETLVSHATEKEIALINDNELNEIKSILSIEMKIPKEEDITIKDIFENREFLLGLRSKECSYLKVQFVNELLCILESSIGNKRPDTSYAFSGSVNMYLSTEGLARWKDAIDRQIEFKPFKDFSHLLPYMDTQQKKQLEDILVQHTAALQKKERYNI